MGITRKSKRRTVSRAAYVFNICRRWPLHSSSAFLLAARIRCRRAASSAGAARAKARRRSRRLTAPANVRREKMIPRSRHPRLDPPREKAAATRPSLLSRLPRVRRSDFGAGSSERLADRFPFQRELLRSSSAPILLSHIVAVKPARDEVGCPLIYASAISPSRGNERKDA